MRCISLSYCLVYAFAGSVYLLTDNEHVGLTGSKLELRVNLSTDVHSGHGVLGIVIRAGILTHLLRVTGVPAHDDLYLVSQTPTSFRTTSTTSFIIGIRKV